ncbi:MAG: topoisomerase IV [Oscillospiraceae bacterium]|nr:topoisomerase IV [Oscillospiraceae bacterium]
MPYAMSVIVSRAIPEIDGFKPSHRKLLYTMYKMGLLSGSRTKSANVVGQTMRLNPHGDASIYETLVRLSKGYNVLLHPFVDSKGNFGKSYSRDMAYAASRYTEVKLAEICKELFLDIDKNTVDFVDNYDNTMKEPALLPVNFPSVLVNSNVGIAVGMASCICSFNLKEICDTTVGLIKNSNHNILSTLKAPDFSTGGFLLYDETELKKIYETGKGSFKVRAKYIYDKSNNCLEIIEIPPSTTIEAIIDKVIELIKIGRLKEISDIRDETDLDGLKIAIDLKRSTDVDKLIAKLFKYTPLEDSFSCNFNILINGNPKVLGIKEILNEWINFRQECVKKRIYFDLNKKKEKLHLLYGLKKILLDIDKAIKIIRNTKQEQDVIPNLIKNFEIDKIQAEFVAEIKLRNLNEEYILNKIKEINILETDINKMQDILSDDNKIKDIIVDELSSISKKYAQERKTQIIKDFVDFKEVESSEIENYSVNFFLTKEGYFKKITPLSLRMSKDHKLKQSDDISQIILGNNTDELLFFSNKYQVYKTKAYDFEDIKASVMGDFLPVKLETESDESIIYMAAIEKYIGYMIFFFENGKVSKVNIKSYETKTNRKKLINAYSNKSKIIAMFYIKQDSYFMIKSKKSRYLILDTSLLSTKASKDTAGVNVFLLRKGDLIESVLEYKLDESNINDPETKKMLSKKIPSTGILNKKNNNNLEQLSLL